MKQILILMLLVSASPLPTCNVFYRWAEDSYFEHQSQKEAYRECLSTSLEMALLQCSSNPEADFLTGTKFKDRDFGSCMAVTITVYQTAFCFNPDE